MWVIESAVKVNRRAIGGVQASEWDITIRQESHEGEEEESKVEHLTYRYITQGNPLNMSCCARFGRFFSGMPTRFDRYPDRNGSAAVVKDLLANDEAAPRLVLKSFHRKVWQNSRNSFHTTVAQLEKAAVFLCAEGVPCYVGEHASRKPFLIMKYLGNGQDLLPQLLLFNALSDEEILGVWVRLLARLQGYFQHAGKPYLDLKPENLMPVFGPEGHLSDLLLIDVEGALGKSIPVPIDFGQRDDVNTILDFPRRKVPLDCQIDWHTLAEVFAFVMAKINKKGFIRTLGRLNSYAPMSHHTEVTPSESLLTQLYHVLNQAKKGDTLPEILASIPNAAGIFEREVSVLQARLKDAQSRARLSLFSESQPRVFPRFPSSGASSLRTAGRGMPSMDSLDSGSEYVRLPSHPS